MPFSVFKTKDEPPTDLNFAAQTDLAIDSDVEKAHIGQTESVNQHHFHNVDPEAEKKLVRKLDRRLVPLVMGLYLLAYLDRSNIG